MPSRCDGLADIADRYGSGTIRLTVWQNLLISDIAEADIEAVKAEIEALGLRLGRDAASASGLVACTGNAGCKFAAADTKRHAMEHRRLPGRAARARHADQHPPDRLPQFVRPALHRRHRPDRHQGRGRRGHGRGLPPVRRRRLRRRAGDRPRAVPRASPPTTLPPIVERMLRGYLAHRAAPDESFDEFVRRHDARDAPRGRRGRGRPPVGSIRLPPSNRPDDIMAISLIPESAPFNAAQRAWLNGFLAGWLGLDGPTAPPARRPPTAPRRSPPAASPTAAARPEAEDRSPGTTRPCRSTSG